MDAAFWIPLPRTASPGIVTGSRPVIAASPKRAREAVAFDGDVVVVVNAVFGDIAEQTVAVTGPVALLLDGGPVPPAGGLTFDMGRATVGTATGSLVTHSDFFLTPV